MSDESRLNAGEEPQSEEIDLRELIAALLDGKWWILGCGLAFLVLGVLYVFLAHPVYRADVLMQIKKPTDVLSGLNKVQELLGAPPEANTEIQIIRSRAVLLPAIAARDLTVSATPREVPVLGRLFVRGDPSIHIAALDGPASWQGRELRLVAQGGDQYVLYSPGGVQLLAGRVGQTERIAQPPGDIAVDVSELDARTGTAFSVRVQPALLVYQQLDRKLQISTQGSNTGVLLMTLEGKDPVAIAETLNAIANSYVAESARLQAAQATKSLQFVNGQLPQLQNQSNAAQAALSAYEASQGRVEMSLEAKAMLDQAAAVQEQLTKVNLQEAQLSQQFTQDYPALQALEQQRETLLAQKAKVQSTIRSLPETQRRLVALTRDATVANDVYSYLLGKSEEFKIQQAASIGNARIVDLAVPPLKAVKPNKRLFVSIALILGLFVGVGVVFLRRLFSGGVDDPDMLEHALGLPVYAVVPHSKAQARLHMAQDHVYRRDIPILAVSDPQDTSVEALRSLRTSLNFALASADNRIVTLGGPRPGVGKSFVAVNLGYVVADTGSRVLIVDADMRRGHLNYYFGVERHPGLSQVLSGEFTLESCVVPSKSKGSVDLLPTGILPPDPSVLLMGERFKKLLASAATSYDMVLIDLPPYLAVADGLIVAGQAATNPVVLRAGLHPLREVDHVVARLRQNGASVTGFVLNDLMPRAAAYGYRKYGYSYNYKYSRKHE